jgi:2-(1,2-epoxy-1,2-dihydrophenyl)acetyl-CoA isomerase
MSSFARMSAPVIVAVNGTAAGAGFGLAVCGDLVVASEGAKFTMAYSKIGLSPDGGASYFLPRLIGLRRTQELMFTNRVLSAQEACDWGLVNQVVGPDELMAVAGKLANELAVGSLGSHAAIKRLLCDSASNSLETQLELEAQCISINADSADGREGVSAFLEKRAAEFGRS